MRTFSLLTTVLVSFSLTAVLRAQDADKGAPSWAAPTSQENVFCVDDRYGVPEAFRQPLPSGLKTIADLTAAIHEATGYSVTFRRLSESEELLSSQSPLKVDVEGLRIDVALDRLDDEPQRIGWRINAETLALFQYDEPS